MKIKKKKVVFLYTTCIIRHSNLFFCGLIFFLFQSPVDQRIQKNGILLFFHDAFILVSLVLYMYSYPRPSNHMTAMLHSHPTIHRRQSIKNGGARHNMCRYHTNCTNRTKRRAYVLFSATDFQKYLSSIHIGAASLLFGKHCIQDDTRFTD